MNGEFRGVQAALNRMRFDRSPFIPRTSQEYSRHEAEMTAEKAEQSRLKLEQVKTDEETARKQERQPRVPFVPGEYLHNRATGLAQESIWSPLWQPTEEHPLAPWPSLDEFKEEGDERHTSGFGRYLPIPRAPGNSTVAWKQKPFIEMYSLDQVHHVPRKYPLELRGDYEHVEPLYDNEGNVIDDPNEPGKTVLVDDLRGRFTLTPSSGALVPHGPGRQAYPLQDSWLIFSVPTGPRQITYPRGSTIKGNTGIQRRQSNLNPGVPEFAPRYHNVPSMESLQRHLHGTAARSNLATSVYSQGQSGSQGRSSGRAQNFGANPFAALTSFEISDRSSQASMRSSTRPPSAQPSHSGAAIAEPGRRMDKGKVKQVLSDRDLTFGLPEWMLGKEREEAKAARAKARENEATQSQTHEQAQEHIIRAFRLPPLDFVSKATQSRVSAGTQAENHPSAAGFGNQGQMGGGAFETPTIVPGPGHVGYSLSHTNVGHFNQGLRNLQSYEPAANPQLFVQTQIANQDPFGSTPQTARRVSGFGSAHGPALPAGHTSQQQYVPAYGLGSARGLGGIAYPPTSTSAGPGALGFPPSTGAYVAAQYRTGAYLNSPFFQNGVPLTSSIGGEPAPELTMSAQEYLASNPHGGISNATVTPAPGFPQFPPQNFNIGQNDASSASGIFQGVTAAPPFAVSSDAGYSQLPQQQQEIGANSQSVSRNLNRTQSQQSRVPSCGSSQRQSDSRPRQNRGSMPHYKDLEDDDELQYYESVSLAQRQTHHRFPFVDDQDNGDEYDDEGEDEEDVFVTPAGSKEISPVDGPTIGFKKMSI
ncbi:MAG: hypothetical protein MMC23_007528 [Stictis urceolatum]|nr:hypothetical protein [Stictis urceolata]